MTRASIVVPIVYDESRTTADEIAGVIDGLLRAGMNLEAFEEHRPLTIGEPRVAWIERKK